jgi:uncharacterized protein (UPF0548 family)
MFLLHQPSDLEISAFLRQQRDQPFSYSPTGLTLDQLTTGYTVDHNRIQIGTGEDCFAQAVAAIKTWKMFDMDWLRLWSSDAPIEVGSTVAIVVKHLGFWSINACRIVYVVDQRNENPQFGFAYGTLPAHAEFGEERFTVKLEPDGSVWYDILAVSRPGRWARLAYPYARHLQKRFARDSKLAMQKALAATT